MNCRRRAFQGRPDDAKRQDKGRYLDAPGFRLQVVRKASGATEEDARARVNDLYEFVHDGLRLSARTKEPVTGLFGSNVSVNFNLTLPRDRRADVTVSSANGGLTLDSLSGPSLKASTANGRIEAVRLNFDKADLDSANGRIVFGGHADDLTINTANGEDRRRLAGSGAVGTRYCQRKDRAECQERPQRCIRS